MWMSGTGRMLMFVIALLALQSGHAESIDNLTAVFARLDKTASEFRSAESSFEWDQYQKVVDSTDKQSGKVYFRRVGAEIQMIADVTNPRPAKVVLFSGGKVQLFQPNIDHLDVYATGNNRAAVESFLVLGFGGSSRDLLKSFEVTYGGHETLEGSETDRLELDPKADRVKSMFTHIELWIDTRGISIQQKLVSPEGDFRLARYSGVVLNKRIPDNVFKLKTTGKTQIENH